MITKKIIVLSSLLSLSIILLILKTAQDNPELLPKPSSREGLILNLKGNL